MIWASYVEPISSRHSPIQTYFLLFPLWLSLAVLLLCQIFTSVVNKVEKCIYLSFCFASCKLLSRIMLMSHWKVLHALSSFISGHATLCRVSWGTELLRSAVVNQIRDPVEWWLRFLLLRCVSRIGSSCVSAAITVHPFVPKPDWCIFRPLAFLQILPQWHRVSVILPSNVIKPILFIVIDLFRFAFNCLSCWVSYPSLLPGGSRGVVLYCVP